MNTQLHTRLKRSSFFDGVAKILDFGQTPRRQGRKQEDADALAIMSDWHEIGEDFKIAIEQFEDEAQIDEKTKAKIKAITYSKAATQGA